MDLTLFLKPFHFSRLLVALYSFKVWLYSSFHQLLDYFVILTHFEFAFHVWSMLEAREIIASSNLLESDKSNTLILLIVYETSLIKLDSSSLFFAMECLNKTIWYQPKLSVAYGPKKVVSLGIWNDCWVLLIHFERTWDQWSSLNCYLNPDTWWKHCESETKVLN